MGLDGIDKADIFDEYFDDDKPKQTNYEKIKSMSVDEMTKKIYIHAKNACLCCIGCQIVDVENCTDGIKQWLLAEVEE